jgi:hypothetical protein
MALNNDFRVCHFISLTDSRWRKLHADHATRITRKKFKQALKKTSSMTTE